MEGRIVLLHPAKKVAHVSPPLKALPVTALILTQVTGKPQKPHALAPYTGTLRSVLCPLASREAGVSPEAQSLGLFLL